MPISQNLLYVEDEAIVAMSVTIALEEAGFRVEHVLDGRVAVTVLQNRADDFAGLVTDVRLPEVDGWLIARHARQMRADLPVVYVSGDSAADWSANGVEGSVMLQKPVTNEQLIATVRRLIGPT